MTEKELTIFFIAFNLSSLLLFWKEGRRNIVMIVEVHFKQSILLAVDS
jgi:hypothetical protein